MTELIKQGLRHKGFAFIDVFSPCVTYNHDNTYPWFKQRVKKLEDDPSYDPSNFMMAMEKSQFWGDEIPSANSSSARTGRRWKQWSPCWTKVARWLIAMCASSRKW